MTPRSNRSSKSRPCFMPLGGGHSMFTRLPCARAAASIAAASVKLGAMRAWQKTCFARLQRRDAERRMALRRGADPYDIQVRPAHDIFPALSDFGDAETPWRPPRPIPRCGLQITTTSASWTFCRLGSCRSRIIAPAPMMPMRVLRDAIRNPIRFLSQAAAVAMRPLHDLFVAFSRKKTNIPVCAPRHNG